MLPGGTTKGERMTSNAFALAASVILLFPMAYFLLTSPTFLLVQLEVPEVARLLRGHFHGSFLMMSIAGALATVGFAAAGRPVFALGIGLLAAFWVFARRWFLQRIDAELSAKEAGDADAVRRLRRLHWGGMLSNAIQLAAIVVSVPYVTST
jgi:hypothetical protein